MESPPSQTGRHHEAAAAEFVGSCEELGSLLERYRKAAAGLYRDNFEALSTMYLTIMELWTVLDASAVNLVPLLQEYAPGFPLGHFDSLVLPKREQLERLARVEDYLARRRAAAGSNGPPWQLRSSDGSWSETCFPARYYDSSPQHRLLRLNITRRAQELYAEVQKRATSVSEATRAAAAARAASDAAATRAAESWGLGKAAKHKAAVKAAAAARAAAATATAEAARAAKVVWAAEALDSTKATEIQDKLWSTFFIWPLPKNETAIKVVVFETEPPAAVTAWRESTLSILAGFCDTDPNQLDREPEAEFSPRPLALCYPGSHPLIAGSLARQDGGALGRFQLGFQVDKSRGWHDAVPQYESSGTRLGRPFQVKFIGDNCDFYDRFSELGSHTLLSRSLHASTLRTWSRRQGYAPDTISPILQQWILGTTHTSNDVLAAQSQCPENMTLDEFRAFGSLRAGSQLQWHNILLQLTIPSLDLNCPETFFLVMQAANEAGPRGDYGQGAARSTHAILGEQRFGDALLGALEDALDRVVRKWESDVSLCILVSLAVRLLSMSSHPSVQGRSLAYLQRLRRKATDRVRRLAEQLRSCGAADEEQRGRLGRRAYTMALISAATLDVGATHATSVLSDRDESALLIEASIFAAEHAPPSRIPNNPTTPILDVLLHRWRRLSYDAEPLLKDLIVNQGSPCLDMAARAVWPSYARGTGWSPAPAPHEHVLVASIPAKAGSRDALSLRYNLLTGHFMVGGSPFSSLPAIFHEHASYRRTFGSGAFTVIPSYLGSQGMQYMATSRYHGHDLHLAMLGRGGKRLVVRSEKKGVTYELIPPENFGCDFPSRLLDGYVHWLVLGQERIEFRPPDMAWQTLEEAGPLSDEYYVLDFSAAAARLTKANSRTEAVVDIRSETACFLHTILRPLESPRFIDIALDQGRSVLKINLQRLRLSFNVGSGGTTMASEQYRDYHVDKDQFLGTLTSLTSKLVLRRSYSETAGGQLDTRLVLVPVGEVSFTTGPEDVHARSASRARDDADHVQHHAFRVDAILGCLRDSSTLSSKLFLCHLHAITTHCLPDKLTGRTGTEEALRILRSAAVQSASQLQDEDVDRLRQIANFSPSWHTDRYERRRPILHWQRAVPRAAQDGAFRELVASIPGHSEPLLSHIESLMRRAATRTSAYRIPQYGAAQQRQPWQRRQPAGKRADVDYAGYNSFPAARMRELKVCRFTRHMMDSGDQVTLLHPIQGSSTSLPLFDNELSLEKQQQHRPSTPRADFSIRWISSKETIPAKMLCALLQEIDSIRRGGKHRYKLILFLAGVLFSPIHSGDVAQLLLAVASAPMVRISAAESGKKRLEGPVVEMDLVQELAKAASRYSDRDMKSRLSDLIMHINTLPIVGRDDTEPALRAPAFSENMKPARPRGFFTSVQDMFGHLAPARTWTRRRPLETKSACGYDPIPEETPGERLQPELPRLLGDLRGMARLEHEQRYVDELGRGVGALQEDLERRAARQRNLVGRTEVDGAQDQVRPLLPLLEHLEACRREVAGMFAAICDALSGDMEPAQQLLPAITPMLLLERLSARYRAELSGAWLRCLVDYAVSLTALQRAERMVRAADDGDMEALARERRNIGHQNWDPLKFPDWLLLEIEMGILIRPLQTLVASAMMAPPGARNHVVQLNMGEGKSSVVVPMVAAALANSRCCLVRVIVARPQSKQMAHTLTRALGGLLHRHVYQLPPIQRGSGARSLVPDLRAQWMACLLGGGVLLAQPEHLLSLRLSGLEALLLPPHLEPVGSAEPAGGEGSLLGLQYFLDGNARDVVDESDDILSTKSELTYTMGSQRPPDLGPARWRIIQSVLGLVAEVAPALGREHPDQLEVGPRPEGHFPPIRVLNEAGADLLADRVVQRIRDGGLATFTPVAGWQRDIREAALRYIAQLELAAGDVAVIQASFATEELLRSLFLLRGLIAHRVLCFALQKRWRVDYGRADNKRSPPTGLAVPFRAKDSPSPRSEFSHPDVVIILTCLSYYYGGLRNDEVSCLIERLLLSVDGEREYLTWVQSAPNGIPQALGQLGALDSQDRQQCAVDVAPHLQHLRLAVNYYLSSIVFAREMREYPQKLSESAWSLAATRTHPVTGFSGTNDTKYLFPLSIESLDLEEQRHANAMVLNHLLRPENTVRDVPSAAAAADMPTWQLLLRHVVNSVPPIRVLLDAGAQIVELGNAEIARRWLDLVPAADASAAVFFNSDEDMCVTARDGTTEPFLRSPYADDMTSCLVYLDEAHARGTDLRLPNDHRAAVTLGPGMTKDRLVQACMRMRGLGRGQSVVFLVPVEIRRKITALRGMAQDGDIEVADVLAWTISETWHEARRLTPLWASQGLRHQRQQLLWDQAGKGGGGYQLSHEAAAGFLESESSSLTLREQYHDDSRSSRLPQQQAPPPAGQPSDVARILARYESLRGVAGGWSHAHVGLEEEQVREVLVEAEAEAEAKHPKTSLAPVRSLKSSRLHKDVEAFIATGTIPNSSPAFIPALGALAGSSIAHLLEGLRWPPDFPLFVTADFSRTVSFPGTDTASSDAYQRPVQWIATAPTRHAVDAAAAVVVVVLSPCEADAVMPTFRAGGTAATLHLFAPRTSLVTCSVQDLLLYATPAPPAGWQAPHHALVLTLLLFAGQLYLRTYNDYVDMCRLLGAPYRTGANKDEEGGQTGDDDERGVFGPAAVPFFLGLFERIRYPSVDISNTDVGSILGANVLPPSAFFGRSRAR